ncbi:hypothetical protein GJAV_G00056500 [Gymnothorax javanicus]|nr:hypothetical protein GJAV_G00056500 [Gymnothorax javanicus]
MAHSCRWRFPARPGGNSISGSWRRAGRVRVTAALRTVSDTLRNTNGIVLGFDAAVQVSAAIGNNLQKFRAILGDTSGSSSGEEEEFCGFGTTDALRRKPSSPTCPAAKAPLEKRPRGRPRRIPTVPQITSNEKPQEVNPSPEQTLGKVNWSPERFVVSRGKRRGRPPRSAQRANAGTGEHPGREQQATGGSVCSQNVPEGQMEGQWGAPRARRFHRTKVKLKSGLRAAGRRGVAIPVAPRRRRGRPPSAERLRAGLLVAPGHLGPHSGVGELDPPTPQHFKLRSTQTTDTSTDSSPNSTPAPTALRRVLGIRQSPRQIKPGRIIPPSRRSDAAIAKQLLLRAKKGVAGRGCPGGAGRDRVMRRRWTQLKNIRQFRMPVVSTISMRVIKTPKRFIEDEGGFRAPPPHAKMARLDAAPSASLTTSPASGMSEAPIPVASVPPLPSAPTVSSLSGTVSQNSSRSSSPSLDSSSEAQSPPPPPQSPPPSSKRGRTDQQRSILRQPTFRWTSALSQRQCFSSAKYAKEGLIRKPVFDNFQPPPLTARDVGLLPPCAGVGPGVSYTASSRSTAIGGFFPPLPAHHPLQPSSRFGVTLHKLRPPLHKSRPLLRAPRFTPSEAHSRIFESVTIPKPRAPSVSEPRASLIGQGSRRGRRGQARSASHSMTTRSSQSGAQAGKGSLQPGNSVVGSLPTRALPHASFGAFTARPTSLSAESTIHRPASSSSSSLLMFASSLQAAGQELGMGGQEKVSSSPQEDPAKEKGVEEQLEDENKMVVEKESEGSGMAGAVGGVSGRPPCAPAEEGTVTEETAPCSTPENGSADTTEDASTAGPGLKAFGSDLSRRPHSQAAVVQKWSG